MVRQILTAHRAAGQPWAMAWARACDSVQGLGNEAQATRAALAATEAGWCSAYTGDAVWGGPECAALLGVIGEEPGRRADLLLG